jgi:hypothetical protein
MSPDVRFGHRSAFGVASMAFRSRGENLRFAIRAALGFLRRLHDTGHPELEAE